MAEWKCLTERRWCKRDNMCEECSLQHEKAETVAAIKAQSAPTPERIAAALALADQFDREQANSCKCPSALQLELLRTYRATLPKPLSLEERVSRLERVTEMAPYYGKSELLRAIRDELENAGR